MKKKGYHSKTLSFNRLMVAASASVTKEKNTIHCISETDISIPRRLIKEHYEKTGEKISLTAYIVRCLARVIQDHPELNSFIKRKKLIIMDDITISVLIERELADEKVPEPIGIMKAREKTILQIQDEIRDARKNEGNKLGNLSGTTWVRFIPGFLLRTFVRIAEKNIRMAKRYGKICVTAVGMFSKDAAWFIPHGTTTVLITVGGISEKTVEIDGKFVSREHLCLTGSFDHNIVDGAPAARFMKQFTGMIKSGVILKQETGNGMKK
ncbi:MAG: 2-oxo acid dehydrogenase subunit E2 [Bacteroidales bacterium]|nr:2-oxo acid dehydrogenase subunit E2 [Bacteroidales bacterium]